MITCTYTFKDNPVDEYSYKELIDYFINNIKDFNDDIVFSKMKTQDAIFSDILEKKLTLLATLTSSGEPDYTESNKFTTQTFIDSNSFTVNGTRPILQQTDTEYLENLIKAFKDEGHSDEESEMLAKNQIQSGKIIALDAKDLHVLINSFNWNRADLLEWIDHCKGTKFESLAVPIFQQIETGEKSLRKILYARHKLSNQSAKIITGVNLKAYVDILGEDIFGHFDNIVIDNSGNLHIYNYKLTSTPISEWKAVKLEKYKYQMALLKLILAANGYDVRNCELHIIPIRVNYDNNYLNITDITFHNTDNIEFTIENNKYVFHKYDDVAKYFIKSPTNFDKILSEQLNAINGKLAVFFPEKGVKYDGISKTADEWIKENYNSRVQLRIKDSSEPGISYELYFNDDFTDPVKIKSSEFPYKNEEIKREVEKHIKEILNNGVLTQKILRTILNSRSMGYSTFGTQSGKAFGYSGLHLGITLSKYFVFLEINGKKIYDWDIIEDDSLSAAGIVMFKNRDTGQIDVITLSTFNLDKQTSFKDRKNIMGAYIPDNTKMGKLVEYPATFGNIEALRTMVILNEVLGNFDTSDFKLGQIVVLSSSGQGRTKYYDIGKFNKDCFQECIQIVKRNNPEFQINNNFSKILFIDPISLVKQQFLNIIDSNNHLFSISEKLNISDLNFENLENENSKVIKAEMIRNIMQNLEKEYESLLRTSNIEKIFEISKRNYGKESQIATLYLYLAKALNYYSGVNVFDEKYLNKFDKNGFIQTRVPNRTYRGVVNMFTSTINDIASQVQSAYNPIGIFIDEYLIKKGYSTTKNSLLGNLASYFKNLYKRNSKGELMMEFRNPYLNSDEFGSLDLDERTLLKKSLFCLAKIRSEMYGITFNYSRYDDPELLKFIELHKSWYFHVPLMKATSASTLLKGAKAQIQEWSRKAKTLLKDGKRRFDEFVTGTSEEDSQQYDIDVTTLNLTNPFVKGDGIKSETSRASYLNNHEPDYFEYDLTTIMSHYITEHIKTKELNKTLITAKAVMLELELLGDTSGDTKGIKQTIELINDHIKKNLFNQSLMEPIELKIVGWLAPFRTLVSDAFIAGNIVSMFRDVFEGVWLNTIRTLNNYLTDLNSKSVLGAYKEVIVGALQNVYSVHKVDLLCKLYRLSNMDVYKIADSVSSSKSGAFNVDNWMYFTLRAPDFLNRMVLFVARCMQDGCWDAYSVENGRLKYDPRKDKRFAAYFTASPNSKEYLEAKTKYYNAIRQYNSDNPNNQITYNDLLPVAYSKQEIENLRNLSNSIYGAYDLSMRARYEHMAIGWAFGTFSTWMNGIVANYMTKPGLYYDSDLSLEQDIDESGNKLWIQENGNEAAEIVDENGNITYIDVNTGKQVVKNKDWCKAMRYVPRVVLGIYYTIKQIFPAIKNKKFREEILNDPMQYANFKKFYTDLLMWIIFFFLFKCALDPAYKEYKKDMKHHSAVQNAITEVLYKSSSRSYDGFGGLLNVILYLGEDTNPPVYSLPIKIITDATKVCFTDKTLLQMLHSDIAVFRTFQDTYKAELKK